MSLVGVAIATLAAPAEAQSFGQWWWTGNAYLLGQSFDNEVDGQPSSSSDNTQLRLALDLNGYIVHPAVARFRLGLDTTLASSGGSFALDTSNWGYQLDLDLLPASSTPVRMYFGQSFLDYSGASQGEDLALTGVADRITRFGLFARAVNTIFKGSEIGWSRDTFSFVGRNTSDEVRENAFAQWSRASRNFRHTLRLQRDYTSFGTIDFATEDLKLTLDEGGNIGRGWNWATYGLGIRRDLQSGSSSRLIETVRLNNRFTRSLGNDRLQLNYLINAASADRGYIWIHNLSGSYIWVLSGGWSLSSTVGLAAQQRTNSDSLTPFGSTTVNNNWRLGKFALGLSAGVNLSQSRQKYREGDATQNAFGVSTQLSLAHGRPEGLQKQLELLYSQNELRSAADEDLDLPDLGVSITGIAATDLAEARLSLRRQWRGAQFQARIETRQRTRADDRIDLESFTLTQSTASASLGRGSLSFGLSASQSEVELDQRLASSARSANANFGWRVQRDLRVHGGASIFDQQDPLFPDVRSERFDFGATYHVGLLDLSARFVQTTVLPVDGSERRNRLLIWTISRTFGGWLPVVSAPKRKGTIR